MHKFIWNNFIIVDESAKGKGKASQSLVVSSNKKDPQLIKRLTDEKILNIYNKSSDPQNLLYHVAHARR